MLSELREDNGELAKRMREAHNMIDEQKDVATAVCWRYSLTRRHVASGFCMRQAIYVAQYIATRSLVAFCGMIRSSLQADSWLRHSRS